jgi:hypothetical protein
MATIVAMIMLTKKAQTKSMVELAAAHMCG